jgi:hypothetical protein
MTLYLGDRRSLPVLSNRLHRLWDRCCHGNRQLTFVQLHHHPSSCAIATVLWFIFIIVICICFLILSSAFLTLHHQRHRHHHYDDEASDPLSTFDPLTLPSDHVHRFILNPTRGCSAETRLLVLIHSHACHSAARTDLRNSWAAPRDHVQVVFLLGQPQTNLSCNQRDLLRESKQHNDLVQGHFLDSYRNLTLKHLMGFRWASDHCSPAPFILKSDDDAFVHLDQLLQMLRHDLIPAVGQSQLLSRPVARTSHADPDPMWSNSLLWTNLDGGLRPMDRLSRKHLVRLNISLQQQMRSLSVGLVDDRLPLLACSLFPDGTPTRRSGKWALSKTEHRSESLPPYCSGLAYVLNRPAAQVLLNAAATYTGSQLHIDDLFVTGILLHHLLPSFRSPGQLALFDWSSRYSYDWRSLQHWTMNRGRVGNDHHDLDQLIWPPMVTDLGECRDRSSLMAAAVARLPVSFNFDQA